MKKRLVIIFSLVLCFSVIFSGCAEQIGMGNDKISIKIENGEATVKEIPNSSTIKEVNIPDEYKGVPVTDIADFAGCNLESVEKISIGKNVKSIGTWAFENNQNLKEFYVDPENECYCSVDGVLFTKDMTEILFYPASHGEEYSVPDGVIKIRTKAFYKCDKIKSLTIPVTVTDIEEKAFFRCSSLENFVIPEGVKTIGKDAFSYCSSLSEITVPKSTKFIGDYAFFNCTNLLTVNMNCKKEDVTSGEKWQPTNNGLEIKKLQINWAE